jgi:hypothetical protein
MEMNIKIVDKYTPREYSSIATNEGVILCDKQEGSFIVLRYPSDLERLKQLLDKIKIVEVL